MNEAGSVGETQLFCEPTSRKDRGWQEIQSHDCCPALRKSQRVGTEMTLKVQDILAVDRPEFRLFYRVQAPTTLTQACQVVAAGAEMQGDQLVPMGAVDRFPRWFTHSYCSRSPKDAAGCEQPQALGSVSMDCVEELAKSRSRKSRFRAPNLTCAAQLQRRRAKTAICAFQPSPG